MKNPEKARQVRWIRKLEKDRRKKEIKLQQFLMARDDNSRKIISFSVPSKGEDKS